MTPEIEAMIKGIPDAVSTAFFDTYNAEITAIEEVYPDLNLGVLGVADIVHNCIASILGSYLYAQDPGMRDYIASKCIFGVSGLVYKYLESLPAIKSTPEPLPEPESV